MRTDKKFTPAQFPQSRADLHVWIREHLNLSRQLQSALFTAVDAVFTRHQQLWEESKEGAIQALSAGFADSMARIQVELVAKDATIASISGHFEQLVTELTDKAHRDPKTKLLNLVRFTEQLVSFLALEQRGRWCAVGLADVRGFKWYNDTLGHAMGDRIIERVAQLLREQTRADVLITKERQGSGARELHARFGGDEFCFLIPGLQEHAQAHAIGERFRNAVAQYDWTFEDDRIAAHPVLVDVGLVCLWLGRVAERRFIARRLAADLMQGADRLMYKAKGERASRIRLERVGLKNGRLAVVTDLNEPAADSSD